MSYACALAALGGAGFGWYPAILLWEHRYLCGYVVVQRK